MIWPAADERRLLGRFYLSATLGYGFALIVPFQFAYLFLAMDQPDWAVIPLIVSNVVALVFEIPTGLLSDRWSRKKTTLLGYGLSGCSWALIPLAVSLEGEQQLLAVCACFALDGLGDALASGSEESWAVDNLKQNGRDDLVDGFFARSYSFEALGSIGAGLVALTLVLTVDVSEPLLDALWVATAVGQMIAIAVLVPVPENRVPETPSAPSRPTPAASVFRVGALRAVFRNKVLLLFMAALVIGAVSDSAPEDAFVISMLSKGMDARALAPLAIAQDVIGLLVPLVALALARLMGVARFLSFFLVLPAIAVSVLFFDTSLWLIIALSLFLDACALFWDPVAETHLHRIISSRRRATATSVANQLTSVGEMAGLAVFALMLGEQRDAIEMATPDLLGAFTGNVDAMHPLPEYALGLGLPDFAIVAFVGLGVFAMPFLWMSVQMTRKPEEPPLHPTFLKLRKGLRGREKR